jgi:hypothetical protein
MKRDFLLKLLTSLFSLIIIFPKKILSDFEYLMPDLAEVKRRCKNYGLQNRVKLFSQCKPYSNSTYNETCTYPIHYLEGFNVSLLLYNTIREKQ